jgi:2-dehydropantoate 2-reductase
MNLIYKWRFKMKYLVIGTGGVGGSIGGFLAANGEDVTFIARGSHLEKLSSEGLKIDSGIKGNVNIFPVKACEKDKFEDKADVIFVCVKGYSLNDIIPLIERAAHSNTLVIPVLNGIGTGDKIYQLFKEGFTIDGCIYIVAYINAPGEIVQSGSIFKVVFGPRKNQEVPLELLNAVKSSLKSTGIEAIISSNIERDTFTKFSFISPFAACGAYYDITAGDMQKTGVYRQTFIELITEIKSIAQAVGISFDIDLVGANLKILDSLKEDTTASLQKDIKADKTAEIEELFFQVVRLSEKLNIDVPRYKIIAEKFGYK